MTQSAVSCRVHFSTTTLKLVSFLVGVQCAFFCVDLFGSDQSTLVINWEKSAGMLFQC